ncbi:hypothetical protein [Thiohalorhabdus methylotrophus]|uniref:Transcription regulator TrmB N-terminal domain-containing protein n=1 Tax=Thiohalorhabdus methylotrophus TaxID=3242694 RepID=A0ABV4TUW2_9GAMM
MEMTVTEYRILLMLGEGRSIADIQESLAHVDCCTKQEIFDELASLLERKLAEPSGSGIRLSELGEHALRKRANGLTGDSQSQ